MKQMETFPGPIRLAEEIAARYRRYLKTTFHFRDVELRRSFAGALEREGSLVNGPYLEASPLYKRGLDCGTLIRELLGEGVEARFADSLNPTRRLYTHQEQAIRTAHAGRNTVVATGTGSGKTEAYLYPILLDLYEEHRRGQRAPGVRALVLYPMNALAEDQRQRLGRLARALNDGGSTFSFTFGRYTGETPNDEGDSRRQARLHLERRLPWELVLRSEMRDAPPDILLTNYSMLEYLLLRPDDSPLFDERRGATWRFIVLDEAHQYRGSKGLEMGMLLRRLKERLRRGGLEAPVRAIATSASLGGAEDRAALAKFAADLFDERFETEGISIGEFASAPSPGDRSLAGRTYVEIHRAIDSGDGAMRRLIEQAAVEIGVEPEDGIDDRGRLHRILSRDGRFGEFRRRVEIDSVNPSNLADEVFEDDPEPEDRRRALESLAALAVWARDPESAVEPLERAPLLNLRYHVFLRALEGAFVRLHPEKAVVLSRGMPSPAAEEESASFEVALCRECGQHYVVGRRADGKLVEAVRDPGAKDRGVEFFRPVEDAPAESENDNLKLSRLCVRCGAISPSREGRDPVELDCGHAGTILVAEESVRESREDQARTCGACGYRGPDPVREVIHGTDGPSAVIATALIANLPESRRKVLAFADGRQEAAFFPCYLEDTYQSVRDRSLLLAVARELAAKGETKEFSLTTLSHHIAAALRERHIAVESEDDLDVRRRAWTILFRELLTDERRLSLEGVGLGSWTPRLPSGLAIPGRLREPPWSLDAEESRHLVEWLLDSLRVDVAMELTAEEQITVGWDALGFLKTQTRAGIGEPAKRTNFKSWDGKDNRRTQFLLRVLGPGYPQEAAREAVGTLLREVWEAFKGCPAELLVRGGDDAFRAKSAWWRFRTLDSADRIFRCDTCSGVQRRSIRGVCGRYRCPGSLQEVTAGDEELVSNHYRVLYEDQRLPSSLRAEEHTAQLDVEKAREFQRHFTEGKIHVLSSSTTFELGVDLGDLDAIFLRNVPPEPFNYAQRVGRAGRRAGHPGFAVTYCRRRPHDLVHFQAPERMMGGRSSQPKLRWTNDKIALRHVAAVLLSEFFRRYPERFKTVEALCGGFQDPQVVSDVERFAHENRRRLEDSLLAVVPPDLWRKLGIEDGTWIDRVRSPEERLARAVAEVLEDHRSVTLFETQSVTAGKYKDAQWARDRASTIAGEDVISFLSRKVVIPKYGFPVDVVELDLHRLRSGTSREALDVTLERDLAVAVGEFAPESTVVANKRLWTSYGLKRVAGREWERRNYSVCRVHGFRSWKKTETTGTPCCDQASPGEYVDPIFGFVTDRTKKPEVARFRPERQFTTRPYFVRPDRNDDPIGLGGAALVWRASPGRLVTLCVGRKGQGFYVCGECGASGTKPLAKHKTPLGATCEGKNSHVRLGHEFLTDVVRVQFFVPVTAHVAEDGGEGFSLSLAYALQHGAAEVLEVPPTDLNVTVRHGASVAGLPEIVLYDNVPGGAGLVAELETPEAFRKSLDLAHRRVDRCDGCTPDTSCYGCLRSYSNQFAHPFLRRGPAAKYLGAVLERWQDGAGAASTYQRNRA